MSRIDTNLATQIADVSRPQAMVQERQQQTNAAVSKIVAQGADSGDSVSAEDARAVATRMKQVVEANGIHHLTFNVDKNNDDEFYMQVTDQTTGNVVQEIPSKEMRSLHTRLREQDLQLLHQAGLFVNKQA